MAGIKEIRTRIASVTNTQKITAAMKMVSAAKLRKAQQAVQQMRPYAEKLQEILVNISADLDTSDNLYATERTVENVAIVAITANGGLCGGFNSNIGKAVFSLVNGEFAGKNVSVFSIGKKGKAALVTRGIEPVYENDDVYDDLSFDNVSKISSMLMKDFVDAKFDKVVLVYNSFRNAATQIVTEKQFLPIVDETVESIDSNFNQDYIYEPNKEYIVEELIPRSLKIQFFDAMLDSHASEHGARMTAMHKATDNAGDMLKDLKVVYNKARQASITNEILEIVSGANALKG